MPVERDVMVSKMTSRGFRCEVAKKHDHYWLWRDGKRTKVLIFVSRGPQYKEYSDTLIGRQAKLAIDPNFCPNSFSRFDISRLLGIIVYYGMLVAYCNGY